MDGPSFAICIVVGILAIASILLVISRRRDRGADLIPAPDPAMELAEASDGRWLIRDNGRAQGTDAERQQWNELNRETILQEQVLVPERTPARAIPQSDRSSVLDDKRGQENARMRQRSDELTKALVAIEGIIYRRRGWEDHRTDEDLDFELSFYRTFGESVEDAFYATIAGTKHRNADGTSRIAAIKRCELLDELDLIPEPDNEFDKNAIGIFSPEFEQMGYLESRLAGEVSRGMLKGKKYTALFRRSEHYGERTVGAVILLCRYRTPDIG